ncbi:MAG: hypothetical protein AB7P69_02965 [Candidatus Binatia bacterium]
MTTIPNQRQEEQRGEQAALQSALEQAICQELGLPQAAFVRRFGLVSGLFNSGSKVEPFLTAPRVFCRI